MGGRVLGFNIKCACIGRHDNPTQETLTQDVHRFNNKRHITTRAIQVLLFPTKIFAEINDADQLNHRKIFPTSLYTTLRAAINLIYESDTNMFFCYLTTAITDVNTNTHISSVDLPPQNNKHRVMLPLILPPQPANE